MAEMILRTVWVEKVYSKIGHCSHFPAYVIKEIGLH